MARNSAVSGTLTGDIGQPGFRRGVPTYLDDYIAEDSPVCVVDASIDELELSARDFEWVRPAAIGRLSRRRCFADRTPLRRPAATDVPESPKWSSFIH